MPWKTRNNARTQATPVRLVHSRSRSALFVAALPAAGSARIEPAHAARQSAAPAVAATETLQIEHENVSEDYFGDVSRDMASEQYAGPDILPHGGTLGGRDLARALLTRA